MTVELETESESSYQLAQAGGLPPAIPDKLYVIIGFNALTNSAQKKETQ